MARCAQHRSQPSSLPCAHQLPWSRRCGALRGAGGLRAAARRWPARAPRSPPPGQAGLASSPAAASRSGRVPAAQQSAHRCGCQHTLATCGPASGFVPLLGSRPRRRARSEPGSLPALSGHSNTSPAVSFRMKTHTRLWKKRTGCTCVGLGGRWRLYMHACATHGTARLSSYHRPHLRAVQPSNRPIVQSSNRPIVRRSLERPASR